MFEAWKELLRSKKFWLLIAGIIAAGAKGQWQEAVAHLSAIYNLMQGGADFAKGDGNPRRQRPWESKKFWVTIASVGFLVATGAPTPLIIEAIAGGLFGFGLADFGKVAGIFKHGK